MLTRLSSLILTSLLLATYALITSCTSQPHYPDELLAIDSLTMSRPDSALLLLSDMAPRMKYEAEPVRRYYQLLTVKSQDKANVQPKTDSLILDLYNYYDNEGDPRLLPQACYYAGRVTRQLGDAPQALDYFHQSLLAMEKQEYQRAMENECHITQDLQSRVHAQMGYLFRQQHLYDEAINSFEQAYIADSADRDTVGQIMDFRDLGNVYFLKSDYNEALSYYEKAHKISLIINDSIRLYELCSNIAWLYDCIGDSKKALEYFYKYPIRTTLQNKNSIYSVHASILSHAGKVEEAETIYLQMLTDNNPAIRSNANLWLGNYARIRGKSDEALHYIREYMQLEDSINKQKNEEAIALSQSLYNYQLREREISELKVNEATLKARSWMYIAMAAIALILLAIAFTLLYKEHMRKLKIKLQYEHLQCIIAASKQHTELKQELSKVSVTDLKNNKTYKKIQKKSNDQQPLTKADWREIENLFNDVMPEFIPKLRGIQSYNDTEWKLSLLAKMDFSWHEIATLASLSYDAIHSSQSRLFKKVFKNDVTYKNWRDFIKSL